MKRIEVTQEMAADLIVFYQNKLAEFEAQAAKAKEILKQLKEGEVREKTTQQTSESATAKKEKRKPRTVVVKKKTKSKLTSGIDFVSFITAFIREKDAPVTASDLINTLATNYSVSDEEDIKKITQAVSRHLISLKRDGAITSQKVQGKAGHFYGFTDWYNEAGEYIHQSS
jgi:hypothetical protein